MIWETVLIGVHFLIAAALIGFILMQHGKGADMGAAFGSGASGSLFGAAGSANFLSRTTAILATVFFLSSLGLTYLATNHDGGAGRDAAGRASRRKRRRPRRRRAICRSKRRPRRRQLRRLPDPKSKAGEIPK